MDYFDPPLLDYLPLFEYEDKVKPQVIYDKDGQLHPLIDERPHASEKKPAAAVANASVHGSARSGVENAKSASQRSTANQD